MKGLSIVVVSVLLLVGCDVNRVYEDNVDLANRVWLEGDVTDFTVELDDASVPYAIYANVRNSHNYPFYNLYLQYAIVDSTGREVKKGLENLILFEPKTGEPYGSGIGDVFDHQIPFLQEYYFPDLGAYTIQLQQYMRRDTLEEIHSVGVRVERAFNE